MSIEVLPDLTEENLRLILKQGTETETLDYKSSCDISKNDELIEIVKDIAAMQILGGYIVIGADNFGVPTGGVTAEHMRVFEQASLAAKVRKFLPASVGIQSRLHSIDANSFVLIYVEPHPKGFVVIDRIANNSKGATIFRPGDVFARHGTASERWNQEDITKIEARLVERLRESWMQQSTQVFTGLVSSMQAGQLSSLPSAVLSWELDSDTFHSIVVELLRRDDTLPIRLLLDEAPRQVARIMETPEQEGRLAPVLDHITGIGALTMQLRQFDLFSQTVESLLVIYNSPIGSDGYSIEPDGTTAANIWFEVILRTFGLGALAVRRKQWPCVSLLARQRGEGYDHRNYSNWFRHAVTMAARGGLLNHESNGRRVPSNLLDHAQSLIERLPFLRPDLLANDKKILNSLCQFDFLVCIASVGQAGESHLAKYYTNFARYFSNRTTPIVARLIEDQCLRDEIYPHDDASLAQALHEVDQTAQRESGFISGWDGFKDYESKTIREFMGTHFVQTRS